MVHTRIREFCKEAKKTGGLIVNNKSRIFKVIKTPVEEQDLLPPEVQETIGYDFFTYDEEERPLSLDPVYGKELEQAYLRKVNSISWDMADLLKQLNSKAAREPEGPSKPVIYLAECSYDRREARYIIEGELKAHGYTVLPESDLPRQEADYVAEVEQLLARSALSIHLVGQMYGGVPDGPSQKSGVVLQNDVAVKRSKNAKEQVFFTLTVTNNSAETTITQCATIVEDAENPYMRGQFSRVVQWLGVCLEVLDPDDLRDALRLQALAYFASGEPDSSEQSVRRLVREVDKSYRTASDDPPFFQAFVSKHRLKFHQRTWFRVDVLAVVGGVTSYVAFFQPEGPQPLPSPTIFGPPN